jgi:purine-binding chemotaxis protein CheW
MRHVVFRVDKERYALPLVAIKEVVAAPKDFTRVPRAPAALKGVMNLRGRVVPVVDLRALLSLKGPATQPALRVVLLDRGRRELGLLITDVDGIEAIEKLVSQAAPGTSVKGLARLGALAVTVLDVDGLDAAVAHAFVTR